MYSGWANGNCDCNLIVVGPPDAYGQTLVFPKTQVGMVTVWPGWRVTLVLAGVAALAWLMVAVSATPSTAASSRTGRRT